jgi:hypothetical protein
LVLSETAVYAGNAQIDRKTGSVDAPMPFNVDGPIEMAAPDCFIVGWGTKTLFISKFDFVNAKVLWRFRVENLKNPGLRVDCDEDTAFFYEDWDDHPVFGVHLQ